MKRLMLLLLASCLFALTYVSDSYAQNFDDYIEEMRGDTAVVKNLADLGEPNSLIDAIEADEDADENRVYLLKRGTNEAPSLYLQDRNYTLPSDRPITIVGEDNGPIVGGTTEDGRPPMIAGTGGQSFQFFIFQNDITLKNLALQNGGGDGEDGWFALEAAGGAHGNTVTIENSLLEHNTWVFVNSNDAENTNLHISDSYFINMTDNATRRNGGVYDSENYRLNELIVENSTHIQAGGMMYKYRNHPPQRVFINQNTFVNSAGQILTSFGYEINKTVTNNLFVNSNVQAYYPGLDAGETDLNYLPHGIINLNYLEGEDYFGDSHSVDSDLLPEGFEESDRKVLVDRNAVYWDERLDDIVDYLNNNNIPCDDADCDEIDDEDWVTQMITMNERTQSMFDDGDTYPLLTESNWHMEGDPGFSELPDLVDEVIEWGIETAQAGNSHLMGKLRSEGNHAETGEPQNMMNFDWPLAVDLSYSNDAYLSGGLGEFPVGDLNWFPEEKAEWEANRGNIYAELEAALDEGRVPSDEDLVSITEVESDVPSDIELRQNYPNPFNPSTQIEFTLNESADVVLEVYDITGRLVTTLVDESRNAGTHSVTWDAANNAGQTVSSGVYIYRLHVGDQTMTRSMSFIK